MKFLSLQSSHTVTSPAFSTDYRPTPATNFAGATMAVLNAQGDIQAIIATPFPLLKMNLLDNFKVTPQSIFSSSPVNAVAIEFTAPVLMHAYDTVIAWTMNAAFANAEPFLASHVSFTSPTQLKTAGTFSVDSDGAQSWKYLYPKVDIIGGQTVSFTVSDVATARTTEACAQFTVVVCRPSLSGVPLRVPDCAQARNTTCIAPQPSFFAQEPVITIGSSLVRDRTTLSVDLAMSVGVSAMAGDRIYFNLPLGSSFTSGTPAVTVDEPATATLSGCVYRPPSQSVVDDFDTNRSPMWSRNNGLVNNHCGPATGKSLKFSAMGERAATTKDLDTRTGGTVAYKIKLGDGTANCASPAIGADVVFEYSVDFGESWTLLQTYIADPATNLANFNWKPISITIPVAAQTEYTRFRWRQTKHKSYTEATDHWAIDDVSVTIGDVSAWQTDSALFKSKESESPFVYCTVGTATGLIGGASFKFTLSGFVNAGFPGHLFTAEEAMVVIHTNSKVATLQKRYARWTPYSELGAKPIDAYVTSGPGTSTQYRVTFAVDAASQPLDNDFFAFEIPRGSQLLQPDHLLVATANSPATPVFKECGFFTPRQLFANKYVDNFRRFIRCRLVSNAPTTAAAGSTISFSISTLMSPWMSSYEVLHYFWYQPGSGSLTSKVGYNTIQVSPLVVPLLSGNLGKHETHSSYTGTGTFRGLVALPNGRQVYASMEIADSGKFLARFDRTSMIPSASSGKLTYRGDNTFIDARNAFVPPVTREYPYPLMYVEGTVAAFRFYKISFDAVRTSGTNWIVQLAEIEFFGPGNKPLVPSTISNPAGTNPTGYEPDKLYDGKTSTSWQDTNTALTSRTLSVDFGEPVTLIAYRFTTSADDMGRDPYTWVVSGIQNRPVLTSSLSKLADQTTPTARHGFYAEVTGLPTGSLFQYFKFEFTKAKNTPATATALQLSEITLFTSDRKPLLPYKITNPGGSNVGERGCGPEKLVDGLVGDYLPTFPALLPAARDFVWIDDSLPRGATCGGASCAWDWISSPPSLIYSGSAAIRRSGLTGYTQFPMTDPLGITIGATTDKIFFYVLLDPVNPPTEIMIELKTSTEGTFAHRAFWGADSISVGTLGTNDRMLMGALPAAGTWARLEFAVSALGFAVSDIITSVALSQFGGTAYWDRIGLVTQRKQAFEFSSEFIDSNFASKGKTTVIVDMGRKVSLISYQLFASSTNPENDPVSWEVTGLNDEPCDPGPLMCASGDSRFIHTNCINRPNQIATYKIDETGGAMETLTSLETGVYTVGQGTPISSITCSNTKPAATSPFLFVGTQDGVLYTFSRSFSDGLLTLLRTNVFTAAIASVSESYATHLFVALTDGRVYLFTIDPDTGVLTASTSATNPLVVPLIGSITAVVGAPQFTQLQDETIPTNTYADFQTVQFTGGRVAKASYGPEGTDQDHTAEVRDVIDAGRRVVYGGIHTVIGDPNPGVPKIFKIWMAGPQGGGKEASFLDPTTNTKYFPFYVVGTNGFIYQYRRTLANDMLPMSTLQVQCGQGPIRSFLINVDGLSAYCVSSDASVYQYLRSPLDGSLSANEDPKVGTFFFSPSFFRDGYYLPEHAEAHTLPTFVLAAGLPKLIGNHVDVHFARRQERVLDLGNAADEPGRLGHARCSQHQRRRRARWLACRQPHRRAHFLAIPLLDRRRLEERRCYHSYTAGWCDVDPRGTFRPRFPRHCSTECTGRIWFPQRRIRPIRRCTYVAI